MNHPASPPPVGPEGRGYDADNPRRRSRRAGREAKRRVARLFVGLTAWLFPYLYYAYCWVVWKTVRHHHDQLNGKIKTALTKHVGVVAVMWHEEVFASAFAYGRLKGSALASTSNLGRIITRMLELCGCDVYRGGSSCGGTRRREVLPDMIRYMDQATHCLYGLTVDGSRGPVYRFKTGALVIARACRTPIYLVRTWFSHNLRLDTWDKTAIPLPFSTLYQDVIGPYWVPPETSDEELRAIRDHLEAELIELADRSLTHAGDVRRPSFPAGWEPRWAEGQVGLPYGPHDLRVSQPPAWARRRLPSEPCRL
ncbi:MAG: DUF374 domain-containing protein [Planctomycetota bacterium]